MHSNDVAHESRWIKLLMQMVLFSIRTTWLFVWSLIGVAQSSPSAYICSKAIASLARPFDRALCFRAVIKEIKSSWKTQYYEKRVNDFTVEGNQAFHPGWSFSKKLSHSRTTFIIIPLLKWKAYSKPELRKSPSRFSRWIPSRHLNRHSITDAPTNTCFSIARSREITIHFCVPFYCCFISMPNS